MVRDLLDALLQPKSALFDERVLKATERVLLRHWGNNHPRVVGR
jgi:hypothetical protein